MTEEEGIFAAVIIVAAAFAMLLVFASQKKAARERRRQRQEAGERMEALFQAAFPELQPHFHPARVLEYVRARRARVPSGSTSTWRKPPGFPGAAEAHLVLEGMKDNVRLVDPAGAEIARFVYEEHPEGGVIRLGKGKFTVGLKGAEPRVRYWHPEREFKWTPSSWKVRSGVSDSPLASSRDTSSPDWSSSSSTSSSSSPSPAATAAAAGGIVAAGGTFDGGGASAAWDDTGSTGSSGSSSDDAPDFSSVESGSSSTSSSTTY